MLQAVTCVFLILDGILKLRWLPELMFLLTNLSPRSDTSPQNTSSLPQIQI